MHIRSVLLLAVRAVLAATDKRRADLSDGLSLELQPPRVWPIPAMQQPPRMGRSPPWWHPAPGYFHPNTEKGCTNWARGFGDCQFVLWNWQIDFYHLTRWNPDIAQQCKQLNKEQFFCVQVDEGHSYDPETQSPPADNPILIIEQCTELPAFSITSHYYGNCQGESYHEVNVPKTGTQRSGRCITTGCNVGSLAIAAEGFCPDGQVQISYWEEPGCRGTWFGYEYTKTNTCHDLWTDGNNFKSIHLRCQNIDQDCETLGTCRRASESRSKDICHVRRWS
ncbi:hypothetical protein IF1G_09326 [Cordyceps javanica]|uniref:Uncharacterized protein n=1 Tax=Cordyceps javanica TaxID=43265 RepID=A0A545US07_9HYPO|nr:hypothetical protein IF1G_09326 [Cordyceps javanica]TQW03958.1 hypothetical protein IF2G_08272 [Cordyceps javanica]